jgi:hypothetical protein
MSPEQDRYIAYHSPEQRASRTETARKVTETAVSDAHHLFFSGDAGAARNRLFSAGLQEEGINFYLHSWGGDQ